MLLIGPLMLEHRLIEKMIVEMEQIRKLLTQESRVDPALIDAAVDFIRIYADRTHHGKEEDILFRDLAGQGLSQGDARLMQELIDEHKLSRKTTGELSAANGRYRAGDEGAPAMMIEKLEALSQLYPQHIAIEDRDFFPSAMRYFDQKERDAMLEEMWAFDKRMIHEKYARVVEDIKRSFGGAS